jgi:hypothetical protein
MIRAKLVPASVDANKAPVEPAPASVEPGSDFSR